MYQCCLPMFNSLKIIPCDIMFAAPSFTMPASKDAMLVRLLRFVRHEGFRNTLSSPSSFWLLEINTIILNSEQHSVKRMNEQFRAKFVFII